MRRSLALACAALGVAAMPYTAHAGCVDDLLNAGGPSDPHSITYHYYSTAQAFVACVV
jgi:hypothetical protein